MMDPAFGYERLTRITSGAMTSCRSEPRGPSGFVFSHERQIHRQVNLSYREDYDHLMGSGLYQELAGQLLISHQEVSDPPPPDGEQAYRVLRPEQIPFLSYPYEWCFSQLKDSALATLKIQSRALHFDMTLKDASAYNIQFLRGKPVLFDTLSFERYREGQPWVAYRQFCQHFLAPLLLMAYRDVRLNQLLRIHLDGAPLDLARTLLPFRALVRPSVLAHIQLHSRASSTSRPGEGRPKSRAFPTCRAPYPGRPNRCSCRWLPGSCCLPRFHGGSASTTSLSRPTQALLALRPAGLLAHLTVDFVTRLRPGQLPNRAAR